MVINPTHAIQVMRPSVWILDSKNPTTAATARKIAVHAPWADTAFKEIDIPSIPDPETKIQTGLRSELKNKNTT